MNDIREQLIKAQNLAERRKVRLKNVKKQLEEAREEIKDLKWFKEDLLNQLKNKDKFKF